VIIKPVTQRFPGVLNVRINEERTSHTPRMPFTIPCHCPRWFQKPIVATTMPKIKKFQGLRFQKPDKKIQIPAITLTHAIMMLYLLFFLDNVIYRAFNINKALHLNGR
jgi:hypothetical protein